MTIHIPSLGDPWDAAWETLLHLQRRQPTGWTLIGAQTVALHGLEQVATVAVSTAVRGSRTVPVIHRVSPPASRSGYLAAGRQAVVGLSRHDE